MWTKENRRRYDRSGLRYESDLTDEEWAEIAPFIPPAKPGGNKRTVNRKRCSATLRRNILTQGGRSGSQHHGISSSMRFCGQPFTKRVSRSVKYACGLTPFNLQVSISDARQAQFSAPSSLPANKLFFLDNATGRMARSTLLLSSSIRPSSRNRSSPSQWFSA